MLQKSIQILEKLVSIASISGTPTKEIVTYIEKYLDSYGVKAVLSFDETKERANVFASFGPNVKGGILLNGHTDVVPVSKGWSTDPFVAEIKEDKILSDENIVKVISKEKLNYENFPTALNFTRKALFKIESNIYQHIGIYAYKAEILEKFFNLKQTQNEKENRLEQLRALDNSLSINIALAKTSPIGVDTEEEYLAIKKIMEYKS